MTRPALTLCTIAHHEEHGKYLQPCDTCGSPMCCGPFHHFCSNPKCAPGMHRACGICGTKVGYCTC